MAQMQVVGITSPLSMRTRDPLQFLVLQAVNDRAHEILREYRQDLANSIANAVGKMLKGD